MQKTKQKIFKGNFFGFDIETYDNNTKFYCGSIVGKDYKKVFMNKEDLISELKLPKFRNSIIASINLCFDFFGIFHLHKEVNNFSTLFRGSELLSAKTYLYDGNFNRENKKSHKSCSLKFLDVLNFAPFSAETLGKILKIPKLEKPEFLGELPKNQEQKEQMLRYNLRDSEIAYQAIEFFIRGFEELGASAKDTIAQTSLSIYKNKFLNESFFVHNELDLKFIFQAYYGGRVEAFIRGKIKDYNYYDVNSLYPSVMEKNIFPNPNTIHRIRINDTKYIHLYEGCSEVEVFCPEMNYPLLPYRFEKKLIFPIGTFRGVYTHAELRKAVDMGYIIKKVYKTIYYTESKLYFSEFVKTLYQKRLEYQKSNSPMEIVCKLLLNSLYGKFAQKFEERDNWIPVPKYEEFIKLEVLDVIGDYARIKAKSEPSSFCVPIFSAYVTSYARIRLHEIIKASNPVYCDTDSVITSKELPTGSGIGELKLVMRIKSGIIIKPKLYMTISEKGEQSIKAKGIKICAGGFDKFILDKKIIYDKILKFKEALRRKKLPNELILDCEKEFDFQDNKRKWQNKEFNPEILEFSEPISAELLIKKVKKEKTARIIKEPEYSKQDLQSAKAFLKNRPLIKKSRGILKEIAIMIHAGINPEFDYNSFAEDKPLAEALKDERE